LKSSFHNLQAGGRWFDPSTAHQQNQEISAIQEAKGLRFMPSLFESLQRGGAG
jgi:hypothetical protein